MKIVNDENKIPNNTHFEKIIWWLYLITFLKIWLSFGIPENIVIAVSRKPINVPTIPIIVLILSVILKLYFIKNLFKINKIIKNVDIKIGTLI